MSGNVLHRMIAFLQPHVKHVVTASVDLDVAEDDERGGSSWIGADPVLHLHRQAVRISKGKRVDFITALRPDEIG